MTEQKNKESAFKPRVFNPENHQALVTQGYSPIVARILAARGVTQASDMDNTLKNLIPVTQLTNVAKMADIISNGIIEGKKFTVVADYDSDGATSCTIVMRAMRGFEADIQYIVPNRFKHGYGLSRTIIDEIIASGDIPDYIITVDNGIASIDGVKAANEAGIKVLVTDHHLQGDEIPDAECIVNPNQKACTFPSKSLAGCGVAWYTMLAVQKFLRNKGWFTSRKEFQVGSLIDFVALGTVADVVPLDKNNRILVENGLKQIREGKSHAGIYALLEVAGRDPAKITSTDFGFVIGPRINAAGRMDDISIGIETLCADDKEHAMDLAHQLDDLNRERKDVEQEMQDSALLDIELSEDKIEENYTLVLHNPDWHEGVIGILASRLKERFYRPTIIFSDAHDNDGNVIGIKGSCRSIPPLNIRNALDLVYKKNPNIIQKFGGHAMAAGLTIHKDGLEEFKVAFEEAAREMMSPTDLSEYVDTDGSLDINEMTVEVAESLVNYPWGQCFPHPTFNDRFKVVSQKSIKNKHMALELEKDGIVFKAIKWKCIEPFPNVIDVQYSISVNEFNGKKTVQMFIDRWETVSMDIKKDVKVDENPFVYDTENGMSF